MTSLRGKQARRALTAEHRPATRDQVDGYGNACSPQVVEWIGRRLRASLDTVEAAA